MKLAVPATLVLLAKAVYNLVDTAYIGMLDSDIALTAVGVTVPLLPIMVSIENIFAAGAAVLAGRQLGAIVFLDPLMRAFGASEASLPLAKDYAFWMFVAALANLPAQSMNCAARAESSVRISSVAVITGAMLNIVLDPIFMFEWGLDLGVGGRIPGHHRVSICHLFHSGLVLCQRPFRYQAQSNGLPSQLGAHQNRHHDRRSHGGHSNLPVGGLLADQYRRRVPAPVG